MTDFEIEKTMITGMVKSLFKGVRVVSAGCDDGSFKIEGRRALCYPLCFWTCPQICAICRDGLRQRPGR